MLVRHFLAEFAAEYGQRPKTIESAALDLFVRFPWRGNVRELRNFIERLMIMVPGPSITEADVPPPVNRQHPEPSAGGERTALPSPASCKTLREARAAFEREFISQKLRENGGNVSRTAEAIDVERSNLHRKIRVLGIDPDQ